VVAIQIAFILKTILGQFKEDLHGEDVAVSMEVLDFLAPVMPLKIYLSVKSIVCKND
jgi:hypothetical protein